MFGFSISATGITDARMRMIAISHNVATINLESPLSVNKVVSQTLSQSGGVKSIIQTLESVWSVDLVSEAMNMKMAELSFAANAKAIKIADSVTGTLIDMVDTEQHRD